MFEVNVTRPRLLPSGSDPLPQSQVTRSPMLQLLVRLLCWFVWWILMVLRWGLGTYLGTAAC